MTIELDTSLAQAEVLFLSYAQLVADIDRRRAENAPFEVEVDRSGKASLRRRVSVGSDKASGSAMENSADGVSTARPMRSTVALPEISDNLRELLDNGRKILEAVE